MRRGGPHPGSRRRLATAALLLLAAGGATAAAADGLMRAAIQTQARRPLPPHKLRMLFGDDPQAYHRFLEDKAAAAAATTPGAVEGDLPLHAGYGTHYAFMYVGTPAQRVSVILDTGSHWTAFPCTGCR